MIITRNRKSVKRVKNWMFKFRHKWWLIRLNLKILISEIYYGLMPKKLRQRLLFKEMMKLDKRMKEIETANKKRKNKLEIYFSDHTLN